LFSVTGKESSGKFGYKQKLLDIFETESGEKSKLD